MLVELLKIEQYVNMAFSICTFRSLFITSFFSKSFFNILLVKNQKQSLFSFKKFKVGYQIKDLQILTDEKWSGFVLNKFFLMLKYTKEGILLL